MSDAHAPRRLRADLPFRRIALVLSGGGALGAYEVGVLRVLEALGLQPSLVAGVSIGAINAVAWLAAGRDAGPLERLWRTATAERIGVQWVTLGLRVTGAITTALALLEVVLTLAGSRELSGSFWVWRRSSARLDLLSTQLDLAFWVVLALAGTLAAVFARRVANEVDGHRELRPERTRARLATATLIAVALHAFVWFMGWPWPHRFGASLAVLLGFAWLLTQSGSGGRWLRGLAVGLMPETGGRGLWSGTARRRILQELVAAGDARRIAGPGTSLVVSALAVDNGRIGHFVSWPDPAPDFAARLRVELGEVVPAASPETMIAAAVASSAIPYVFQPERIGGRDFVDAGGFSNQPLHVAIAHGSDAVLAVCMVPSAAPSPDCPEGLGGLGGRLLELANWRDLRTELRHLPSGWEVGATPSRICVVEPGAPLPATMLAFEPESAGRLIELGRRDAWAALERAGWLEPEPRA